MLIPSSTWPFHNSLESQHIYADVYMDVGKPLQEPLYHLLRFQLVAPDQIGN